MIEHVEELVADDGNVPVDIWITEIKESDRAWHDGYRYRLKCGNYMPRKAIVSEYAAEIISDNLEELRAIVRDRIIPIYRAAMSRLQGMVDGTCDKLYYWEGLSDEEVNKGLADCTPEELEILKAVPPGERKAVLDAAGPSINFRTVHEWYGHLAQRVRLHLTGK